MLCPHLGAEHYCVRRTWRALRGALVRTGSGGAEHDCARGTVLGGHPAGAGRAGGHSGGVTSPDPAALGRERADRLVGLLEAGDGPRADALLADLDEVRALVYVGAALTSLARAEGRALPPAQRAQANTRQLNLGTVRDAARDDPAALRRWLQRSAEELLLLRSLRAAADRIAG